MGVFIRDDGSHGYRSCPFDSIDRHSCQGCVSWRSYTSGGGIFEAPCRRSPRRHDEEIRNVPAGSEVIVWMESPSNPLCEVVDLAAITTAVKGIESHVITTVVDLTMASPIVTRPLEVSISDHTISFRNNVVLLLPPFGCLPLIWSSLVQTFPCTLEPNIWPVTRMPFWVS